MTEKSTVFQFEFTTPITHFRNHDYTWIKLEMGHIANSYAPKVLKLDNSQIVQANQYSGIWEVDGSNPKILHWCFNIEKSTPLAQFNLNNNKSISYAYCLAELPSPLGLLFPKHSGIELSRSKIAFSAVACFTDHCDFDTHENLRKQRKFFKKFKIKITKGFFFKTLFKTFKYCKR